MIYTPDVIAVGEDAIDWSFSDGQARLRLPLGDWTRPEVVDPFPGYSHDLELVRSTLDDVMARWPAGGPLVVAVADRESVGRTNGWATHQHVPRHHDGEPRLPAGAALIFLSGKRIPPHPAMTRHLIGHEYGHQVQHWLEHEADLDYDDLLQEYSELRPGTELAYGGGRWHCNVGEVFACDFRILIAGLEHEFWPHRGIPHPLTDNKVMAWWRDRYWHWAGRALPEAA